VRFCPFCREAFEVGERCPTHDLQLVSLRELGAISAADVPDDARVPVWSGRLGRAEVCVGALATLIGFLCPFGSLSGDLRVTSTLYALARGRAPRLWIVPMAALALLMLLVRRRSAIALRGARLSALIVSLLPSAVLLFTWFGARAAASRIALQTHGELHFRLGIGAIIVWLALLPLLWGSLRLGVRRKLRVR
jgi:hypothetical protein